MVDVELRHVQRLKDEVADQSVTKAKRELAVRVFCNEFKASAPQPERAPDDPTLWTSIDTDHLLEISYQSAALENYLIERVVAAE